MAVCLHASRGFNRTGENHTKRTTTRYWSVWTVDSKETLFTRCFIDSIWTLFFNSQMKKKHDIFSKIFSRTRWKKIKFCSSGKTALWLRLNQDHKILHFLNLCSYDFSPVMIYLWPHKAELRAENKLFGRQQLAEKIAYFFFFSFLGNKGELTIIQTDWEIILLYYCNFSICFPLQSKVS